MATKAKTTKEERNYKPAHVAQPAKKTDTRKIVKAVIFGPTIAILGVTLIYLSWWGIAKAFMALHSVVTTHFVPWVGESWPIIIGAWAIVALTSVVYYFVEQYLKENKKEKPVKQQPAKKQQTTPKKTESTPTIFDTNPNEELSIQELDQVGAFPYMEELDDFSKEISGIFTIKTDKSEEKAKNPEGFISLGKPEA